MHPAMIIAPTFVEMLANKLGAIFSGLHRISLPTRVEKNNRDIILHSSRSPAFSLHFLEGANFSRSFHCSRQGRKKENDSIFRLVLALIPSPAMAVWRCHLVVYEFTSAPSPASSRLPYAKSGKWIPTSFSACWRGLSAIAPSSMRAVVIAQICSMVTARNCEIICSFLKKKNKLIGVNIWKCPKEVFSAYPKCWAWLRNKKIFLSKRAENLIKELFRYRASEIS